MVDASTPQALVKAYMADFTAWNDAAIAKSEAAGDAKSAAMDWASAAYAEMISQYAPPGTPLQGIAFGNESNHQPDAEQIQDTLIDGDKALVKTLYTHPKFEFLKSRYEYELIEKDGRWWITQVFFVDDDGRYPGL